MLKGIIAGVALSGACIAFFTVGCSLELASATKDAGNDQPDTGCTITLSGAATGSYPCTTTAVYLVADGGESAISVTDTTQTFQVVFEHPGIFTSESFDGGDASAWQTELLASGINGGDWACISNHSPTPDIGSFSATVDVETSPPPTMNGLYTVSGSVNGTLIYTSGEQDAAPLMLNASF